MQQRLFGELAGCDSTRLIVRPSLGILEALSSGNSAMDVRLGRHFVSTRGTTLKSFDPLGAKPEDFRRQLAAYEEPFQVEYGDDVTLHPRQFVLGCTLEYFRFPLDLSAYVIGRSSWGRSGLVIATATVVHPGFTGVLTLELQNLGEAPIVLKAGCRIGQLLFHEVGRTATPFCYADVYRRSKYVAQTRPALGRVYDDADRPILARLPKVLDKIGPKLLQ